MSKFTQNSKMDNPDLYKESNDLQTETAKKFLNKYIKNIKWKSEGNDIVMDIGCGTGNITYTFLKPMLPKTVKKLIGTDINVNMIKTASDNYKDPKIQFEIFDISGTIPDKFRGKIDHVFSFFCLHWCEDQQKTMENIYSLLTPGGDCLFLMVAQCEQVDNAYETLSKNPRWEKYMLDVERYYLPYRYEKIPEVTLNKYLKNAGFDVIMCEQHKVQFVFSNDKQLEGFLESINPFVNRLPSKEKREYLMELKQIFLSKDPVEDDKLRNNLLLLYVHATKNV